VISWSLGALLGVRRLCGVSVALGPGDPWFDQLPEASDPRVRICAGGEARQDSVRAALGDLLSNGASEADWVLVHDAARPALTPELVRELVDTVGDDPNGGLLAVPVGDTLKYGGVDQHVDTTLPRDGLWAAQTPQYFSIGALLHALDRAREEGLTVTDEASAMEARGYRPRLVMGSYANLKLTYPADSRLLDPLLRSRTLAAEA
jgi:2-C-methyl-D-erythritol 4-phosphate cytidylyltransferase